MAVLLLLYVAIFLFTIFDDVSLFSAHDGVIKKFI